MTALIDIEGIGPKYAATLKEAGVTSTEDYLSKCASPKGRKAMAEATGISDKLILEWTNLADLFRIKGVGEEYADLLEEAGVDTVVELATRKPENLVAKMAEVQRKQETGPPFARPLAGRRLGCAAKQLPRVIEY
jgi:predicted flap endonuclease-1-like 5' DNA nuclease